MFPDTVIVLDRITVRELGAEVAVVHASWTMNGQITPTGERAGTRRGVISFTTVRQQGGRWLAVSAQNTDAVPGMQTHVATGDELKPETYAPRGRPKPAP